MKENKEQESRVHWEFQIVEASLSPRFQTSRKRHSLTYVRLINPMALAQLRQA